MARTRPQLVKTGPAEFKTFSAYVAEANDGIEMFKLPVSEDETLEIGPPTGDDLKLLAKAQRTQDVDLMAEAVFGQHAERLLELTGGENYIVVNMIVRDVMSHYGQKLDSLGE
jgi:hypothetical protein